MTGVAEAAARAVPLWVVIVVGIAGAVATFGVALMGRMAAERNRRRSLYADALRVIIAWTEFPYQVRRRTSDDPETLTRLAELGHQLQMDLAYYETWLAADKPFLGALFGDVVARVKARCGLPLEDAWNAEPVVAASDMVLAGWGPGDCSGEIDVLREAVENRFGWRRPLAAVGLRQPRLPDAPEILDGPGTD